MTGLTLLEDRFTGLGICRSEQLRDRNGNGRRSLATSGGRLFGNDRETFLFRCFGMEDPFDAMETDIRTKIVPSSAPTAVLTYEFICNAPLAAGRP